MTMLSCSAIRPAHTVARPCRIPTELPVPPRTFALYRQAADLSVVWRQQGDGRQSSIRYLGACLHRIMRSSLSFAMGLTTIPKDTYVQKPYF